MQRQPIDPSTLEHMKTRTLFKIIAGGVILYIGAILFFAKLMSMLLLPQ